MVCYDNGSAKIWICKHAVNSPKCAITNYLKVCRSNFACFVLTKIILFEYTSKISGYCSYFHNVADQSDEEPNLWLLPAEPQTEQQQQQQQQQQMWST